MTEDGPLGQAETCRRTNHQIHYSATIWNWFFVNIMYLQGKSETLNSKKPSPCKTLSSEHQCQHFCVYCTLCNCVICSASCTSVGTYEYTKRTIS